MPAVNPGDNYVDPKIRRRHPELDASSCGSSGTGRVRCWVWLDRARARPVASNCGRRTCCCWVGSALRS